MYSPKRQKGNVAEGIVVSHLKNCGFHVIDQNYLKKWGEIDIVAEKSGKLYFFEVKSTVSRVMPEADPPPAENITFDPVWNMTKKKKLSLSRVIRTYLADKYRETIPDFQVDLISVSLDFYKKIGYINRIENILLDYD